VPQARFVAFNCIAMTLLKTYAHRRWLGLAFILPLLCYGIGAALVETLVPITGPQQAMAGWQARLQAQPTLFNWGLGLMMLNSLVVILNGLLWWPVLKRARVVALAYLIARLTEALLLLLGCLGLGFLPVLAAWDVGLAAIGAQAVRYCYGATYQLAMLALALGSVPLFMHLWRSRAIDRRIAMWGICGYALLGIGALLELGGLQVGLLLALPGGALELFLGLWLLAHR
jgi:hypothetical protein